MKAAPMKAVMKAVMKAAPKAKALPLGRGTVGAPMKAVAVKAFAKVAAKAKAAGVSPADKGSGTWYFMSDLRKMKVGVDDDKAWTKFDPKMNKQLEMAYTKNFKQYTSKFGGKTYIVKFKQMMQFRADDKSLQRPVKRV